MGLGVGAAAYATMSLLRIAQETPQKMGELLMLGICLLALTIERRFPRVSTSMVLAGVWLEMVWSISSSSNGIRNGSSAALPVLIIGIALLLGAASAWLAALVTSIALPAGLMVGRLYLDGPGMPSSDITYMVIVEIAIFATTMLLTGFLRTLATVVQREQANALRWQEFVEDAPDAIVAVNAPRVIVAFNRLAESYLGLKREDVLGKPLQVLQEKYPACFPDDANSPATTRPAQLNVGARTLETRVRREHDEGEANQVLFILRDVTEREEAAEKTRTLRSQLNHVQKMDAIGQLAGGVAHDFNNLLTAVCGAAFALQDSEEQETQEIAQELLEASQQGAALTRQLLTFARREVVQARIVDLEASLESSKTLITRVLGERVALDIDAQRGCTVRLDEGQFEQVMLNLAANARDALNGHGTFSLSVRQEKDRAVLRVSDDGCGMPPEVQEHIFEPFFTTKPQNQGTGLGLATIHGIVSQWGGTIEVSSRPNQGTTFTISWPMTDEEVTEITTARTLDVNAAAGEVLLVEDNEPARRFMRRILGRAGYSVTEAGSAEEALTLCHDGARPDILVSDVIMPGLTGVDLATRLHKKWPRLPVLFVSGYVDDVLADWPYDTTRDLLLKPFAANALLERIEKKVRARKRGRVPSTNPGGSLFTGNEL